MGRTRESFVGIEEASRLLGMSTSTVWRRIRSRRLPSVRDGGRRLIPLHALQRIERGESKVPAFHRGHPLFRLVGAGRGGGNSPGARDKHKLLDE